jgi:hypothetical protein
MYDAISLSKYWPFCPPVNSRPLGDNAIALTLLLCATQLCNHLHNAQQSMKHDLIPLRRVTSKLQQQAVHNSTPKRHTT